MSMSGAIRMLRDPKYRRFLISSHVRPDIDALSSELVMAAFLRSMHKTAVIVNEERNEGMYDFIPGIRAIRTYRPRRMAPFDAAVIVDCGDLNRIGRVRQLIDENVPVVNIDHHLTNTGFGHINLVEQGASSTAEVVHLLLKKAGFRINATIAKQLYMGIMTDTGSFRYDSTTAQTHRVVSELMQFRFSVQSIYHQIYERIPLEDFRVFSKLVNSFEISHRGRAVTVVLQQKDIDKFSSHFDLRDRIFTFLRAIKGIEVIIIFTEEERRFTRVNFRSQQKVDVARLAAFFGGGGHKRASGCSLQTTLPEAKARVHRKLDKILEK